MLIENLIYLFLFVSFERTENVRIVSPNAEGRTAKETPIEPVLVDLTDGHLEKELGEAMNDNEQSLSFLGSDRFEFEDEPTDGHVPSSFGRLSSNDDLLDDFDRLSMSEHEIASKDQSIDSFRLNRVAAGEIPTGIEVENYSNNERTRLSELYRDDRVDKRKELLKSIAENIHQKYLNCLSNLAKWIQKPQFDQPIFYQNCVPCTNAVDLNLQSLFDNELQLEPLKHYSVKTCQMTDQWVSYVSDMEFVAVDLSRHRTATFTDVIRQNLLPNQRSFLVSASTAESRSSLALDTSSKASFEPRQITERNEAFSTQPI